MSEKLKVQCQTCKRFLGGTLAQLQAKAACPNCGAGGQWWAQVETRIIQRARLAAEQAQQQYVPPPPVYGQAYVPLTTPNFTTAVFVLGLLSVILFPCGLILGGIGFGLGFSGRGQVKRGEVPSSGLHTAGWVMSIIGLSIGAVLFVIGLISGGMKSDRDRYFETHRTMDTAREKVVEYHRQHKEYPASLEAAGAPTTDGWGRPLAYTEQGYDFEIVSLGADGKPGGTSYDADIRADAWAVNTDVSFLGGDWD